MDNKLKIYRDIAERTGGDIYVGVIGPVRTGKSTFIKRFMENVVLPEMEDGAKKERATDEIPQCAGGRTVMTTEPKFVPEEAVRIELGSGISFRVKLVDCVGFTVEGASGLSDENGVRLINTPWSKDPLPFEEAAALGTKKVIHDHATIGVLVTTDGSFGEIDRNAYLAAEEKVIREMRQSGKPFVVLLNSTHPEDPKTQDLANALSNQYGTKVLAENCFKLQSSDISRILEEIVLQFPVKSVFVSVPGWIMSLDRLNPVREEVLSPLYEIMDRTKKTGEVLEAIRNYQTGRVLRQVQIRSADLGTGNLILQANISEEAFYAVLSDACGLSIGNEEDLVRELKRLSGIRTRFEKIEKALDQAEEKGYGIVLPSTEDMELEEPEIVKQPGGYGVKFKASAPSMHLIRTRVKAEVFPIVGSERQSEDIVKYLLKEYETNPSEIWNSDMFGKKLYELVNESISSKLEQLQSETREKFSGTLEKVINDGSGGLICIIL